MAKEASKGRTDAVRIITSAIHSAKPQNLLGSTLLIQNNRLCVSNDQISKTVNLSDYDSVVVTGYGKACAASARVIEDLLGDKITSGLVAVNPENAVALRKIQCAHGAHPIPDETSIAAAKALLNFARQCGEKTLVLNLVSGGGSSILCAPYADAMHHIYLDEKALITKRLLACGASIKEINAVRKHLSLVKGGRLAQVLYPATVLSLIISDVIGDDISSIASGPTVPDPTTWIDAFGILQKYDLLQHTPQSVIRLFHHGLRGLVPDTPKEGDPVFSRCSNIIIGSNLLACRTAIQEAEKLGYRTLYLGSRIAGDVHKEARAFWRIARQYAQKHTGETRQPLCILAGGEPTVEVTGQGKGGRAQEFALTFLGELMNAPAELGARITMLAAATDGRDGITDASGAFADTQVLEIMKSLPGHLEPQQFIQHNDSYTFFKHCLGLYQSGATGTNVNDIYIALIR